MDFSNFANALGGLGAGMAGRGNEWQQQQMLQREMQNKKLAELDEKRKTAMLQDAKAALMMLKSGKPEDALKLAENRSLAIGKLGGDPTHTNEFRLRLSELMANNAPLDPLIGEMEALVNAGVESGYIKPIEGPQYLKASEISDTGQAYRLENGAPVAVDVAGFRQDTGKAQDRQLRQEQLQIERERLEQQKQKPSATMEKELLRVQDAVVEAQENYSTFETLANDFERLQVSGGIGATLNETLKTLLGDQDAVSDLRRKFSAVRLSQGLKFLPPGPATDKDVEMAMKSVPPENANAETVASFLRGAAKIERFRAAYNQYKSDYLSATGSTKNINKNWRTKFDSPLIKDRKFTLAEIYVTAQEEGITPEEVAAQLQVKLP